MLDKMLDFITALPTDYGWLGSGMGVSVFRLSMGNGADAYGSGCWGAVVLSATACLPDDGPTLTTRTNALNWPSWEGGLRARCRVTMDTVQQ